MFELIINRISYYYGDVVKFLVMFDHNDMKITLHPKNPDIFVDSELIENKNANVIFDFDKCCLILDEKLTITGEQIEIKRTYAISKELSDIVKRISDYIKNEPHLFSIHVID